MNIIIVHGVKPKRTGKLNRNYQTRLKKAAELWNSGHFENILIAGGYTQNTQQSEAKLGKKYLQKLKIPSKVILMEAASKNTAENVIGIKGKLENIDNVETLHVIFTKFGQNRIRFLYETIIGNKYKTIFYEVNTQHTPNKILTYAYETILWQYTKMDPKYEGILARLTKNLFRKGNG